MHNLSCVVVRGLLFSDICCNCCYSGCPTSQPSKAQVCINIPTGAHSVLWAFKVHWMPLMAADKSNNSAPLSVTMAQPAAKPQSQSEVASQLWASCRTTMHLQNGWIANCFGRPEPHHRLVPIDGGKQMGPGNIRCSTLICWQFLPSC